MEEKRCVHCGRILPVSEFYANSKSKDGLQSWCKECFSARKKSMTRGFIPSPPSKDAIEELYLKQCYTVKMVADALSMNKNTLMYWMQRYGIQRRSISEARRTAISLGQIKSRKGEKRSPHSQEARDHMRAAALKRWSSIRAGVSKKKNGYLVVTCGENKHKPVHVVIMEEHIGRKLLPNECVHHINHDRSDNRIENLRLMTRSEHTRLHALERLAAGEDLNHFPKLYGEAVASSKLTREQVLEIRSSTESTKVLMERYKVSKSTINKARSGRSWKHV